MLDALVPMADGHGSPRLLAATNKVDDDNGLSGRRLAGGEAGLLESGCSDQSHRAADVSRQRTHRARQKKFPLLICTNNTRVNKFCCQPSIPLRQQQAGHGKRSTA